MTQMTPTEAREYLRAVVQTETGRGILRQLGYGAAIAAPDQGDDDSAVVIAEASRAELVKRYRL